MIYFIFTGNVKIVSSILRKFDLWFKKKKKLEDIKNKKNLRLYLGNLCPSRQFYQYFNGFFGLANKPYYSKDLDLDLNNIPYPFKDNSVDFLQSEDVFEHFDIENLVKILNEIYRILDFNGHLRISTPDVKSEINKNHFDTEGHIWGPTKEKWIEIINRTSFKNCNIKFLHYVDNNNSHILNKIEDKFMPVCRTPEKDKRYKGKNLVVSIIFDIIKNK